MSADQISDEVALDFQESLQDLQNNNRYEISNLTIIAKENTEHAQAIAMVLEKHIKTTAPGRKLPALYVLDSIVKNVGTPYTVYLGRNLFSTFMDSYTLVDSQTRKSMEAMLKTWKEPVPGSMDPRPVFPAEVTRTIENALIKARTAAVQLQTRNRTPLNMPGRPMSTNYRNTPTPPHNASQFQPPPQDPYQNGFRSQQPTPQHFSSHQLPPDIARSLSAVLNPQDDLNKLKADIHGLIQGFQSEFARNPYDSQVQTKLKALLDLQAVVQSQQLNSDAIGMIKKQVAQLQAVQSQPNPPPSATPQQPQWQAPTPVALPFQPPPPIPQGFAPTPSAQPPVAPPAFAPGILQQLLASTANGQKPSTPVVQAALKAMPHPPANQSPRAAAALPAGPTGNPLLDALRAANILPASASATPVPASGPPIPPPAAPPALSILQQLQGLAPKLSSTPMPPPGTPAKVRIPMNAAALKSFRPEVVHTLYDAQPNQCTTCGRRFLSTDEGRAQKARHLDWHFRSNQRIADAALAAGLTRSWYIDEMEWIRLREVDASSAAADTTSTAVTTSKPVSVREKYIPAPTGAAANATCPICQEKFEPEWHEDAQEWVWMDAVKVGGRVFHASCHDEVKRASGGDRGRSTTPDAGVLGKRKAEADLSNLKTKLKREVAA
ncbi:hypothetical protein M436DRAFT_38594 [Aureobasidium namibiae CBS 147.97]|uniref:CID domain-containing protein n=1 Tax=Aureobasidium namibiae CBS 147.97 TaxID=1043004 RepID=A0A074WZZ8_9PEZI